MTRTLAVVVAVVSMCLAAASAGNATTAAKVCSTFTQGRVTYHTETIGTSWSCAAAKIWIKKLSLDTVPKTVTKNVPLANGPRGLHCFASPMSKGGHATAGECIKGTLAFPKSGFAWFRA